MGQGPPEGVKCRVGALLCLVRATCSRRRLRTFWLATGSVLGVRQKWHGYHGIYTDSLLGPRLGQYCEL